MVYVKFNVIIGGGSLVFVFKSVFILEKVYWDNFMWSFYSRSKVCYVIGYGKNLMCRFVIC